MMPWICCQPAAAVLLHSVFAEADLCLLDTAQRCCGDSRRLAETRMTSQLEKEKEAAREIS